MRSASLETDALGQAGPRWWLTSLSCPILPTFSGARHLFDSVNCTSIRHRDTWSALWRAGTIEGMAQATHFTPDSQVVDTPKTSSPLTFRAVIALVGYAIAWIGLLVLLILMARFIFGASDVLTMNLVAAAIPVHGIGTVLLVRWQLARHGRMFSDLSSTRLSARMLHLIWQVPVMWVALLLSIAVMLPILESLGDPSVGGAASTMVDVSALMAIAVFVGTAIVAPVWEELFFRGIVYRGLRARSGVIPAVLVSSLIFAFVHSVALMVPYFFVMAVAMALIYEFHGNIWAPVTAHAFVNVPISGGTLLAAL